VFDRLRRKVLASVLPQPGLFASLLALGRSVRPLMPSVLKEKVPVAAAPAGPWPNVRHSRRMIALAGCVQPSLAPAINAAAARVLDRVGISLTEVRGAGCCGAVRFHLDYQADGLDDMRALIDAWWPHVESGAEAIVMTASGCGATVKEYGHMLAGDPKYAEKARRISSLTRDLCEVLEPEADRLATDPGEGPRLAFHSPCSLQHGQQLRGVAERILTGAGFRLVPVPDAHLCCGSAGTYSILQEALSMELKRNKLTALQSGMPDLIATANIGCLAHLAVGSRVPVQHWIVALETRLAA
jgi:glycolate oxidase iron-sulfur subunit